MTDQISDPHFPTLHRVQRRGWINDPNGIIRLGDRWHVFFQYNPESARHHRIHWGHVSSSDLVSWREEPLGPAPRAGELDADGCWSGVAAMDGDVPCLVYSGVDGVDNGKARVIVQHGDQQLRTLEPVPGTVADLPDIEGLGGVRDPFLLELDGRRLAIQGAELRRTGPDGTEEMVPAILAWDRSDMRAWRFLGPVVIGDSALAREHAPAHLWECPQLVRLHDEATGEERWLLSLGKWTEPEPDGSMGASLNGVGYLVGTLTWDDSAPVDSSQELGPLQFTPETGGLLDAGPDFYAPQAYVDGDRVLWWGWSWEGASRTQDQTDAQGWAGCLTLPREIALVDGEAAWRRPAELDALRDAVLEIDGDTVTCGHPARVEVVSQDGLRVELVAADGTVLRTVAEHPAGPTEVMVDASIIEVIPASGVPQTVRVYPEEGEVLRVTGKALQGWQLAVPSAAPDQD